MLLSTFTQEYFHFLLFNTSTILSSYHTILEAITFLLPAKIAVSCTEFVLSTSDSLFSTSVYYTDADLIFAFDVFCLVQIGD